jgi:hypothetical protein
MESALVGHWTDRPEAKRGPGSEGNDPLAIWIPPNGSLIAADLGSGHIDAPPAI